jgi:hypothetical protein
MAEPPAVTRFVAQLEATGATVTRVAACIAAPPSLESSRVELELLRAGHIDALLFTSGSEIEGLWHLLGEAKAKASAEEAESAAAARVQPLADASGEGERAIAVDWSGLLPERALTIACHGADAVLGAEIWGLDPHVASQLGLVDELIEGLEQRAGEAQLLSAGVLIL